MGDLIFYFCISFISTFILIPLIIKIAHINNIFDRPDSRKKKISQMVRIGGGAFVLGNIFSILLLFINTQLINKENLNYDLIWIILLGSLGFYFIGLSDDLFNISPYKRLVLQVILSFFIWQTGFRILIPNLEYFYFIKSNILLANSASFILTSFWIVGVINSINWLDGLDGLAVGSSIIFLITFFFVGIQNNDLNIIYLTVPLIGSLLAFLKYNFFPSDIMMGDGGSYFIGFNMSILSILVANSSLDDFIFNKINFSSFFIAIIILAIPLLDMIKVIFTRIFNRKSPFFPDRNHFHYQILNLGFSERNSVLIIYCVNVFFSLIALRLLTNS